MTQDGGASERQPLKLQESKEVGHYFPRDATHAHWCLDSRNILSGGYGRPDFWWLPQIPQHKIGAVWGPHVRLDEINLLFLQIICGVTCCVHWHTILLICPFVLATSCLDRPIRQQTLSQDESTIVWTIDLCAGINEDHVCLTHAGHSDQNHNVSTEVLPFTDQSFRLWYVRFLTNYTQTQ